MSLKKRTSVMVIVLSLLSACGGASLPKAPTLPTGQKIPIAVTIDRSIPQGTGQSKVEQLKEVHSYLERDLVRTLERSGYQAWLVNGSEQAAGAGSYNLTAHVASYNPGSGALRYFFGIWGAGKAHLNVDYEVLDPSGARYLSGHSHGQTGAFSLGWTRAGAEADAKIARAVTDRLSAYQARQIQPAQ